MKGYDGEIPLVHVFHGEDMNTGWTIYISQTLNLSS